MTERLNIISIFCHVFLDLAEHSKKTGTEQIVLKNHINALFNIAFKHIGQTNRIILVTDNGAAIAYSGSPEDAMLMAKEMLNGILISNKQGSAALSACIGIHLEPVHVVNDFNEQPNIIGDGINAAKQMISKAKPNEILVSHSYYEKIPPSIQALSTLFNATLSNELNDKYENHVFDYQAYLATLNLDQISENQPEVLHQPFMPTPDLQPPEKAGFLNTSSWKYALASVFIVVALFSIVDLAITPAETPDKKVKVLPLKASDSTSLKTPSVKPETPLQKTDVDDKESLPMQQELEKTDAVKPAYVNKDVKQKTKNRVDSTSKKSKPDKAISWESFKDSIRQGQEHECTQSEIALNQCR